jgi:hypothetical protein
MELAVVRADRLVWAEAVIHGFLHPVAVAVILIAVVNFGILGYSA